MIAKTQEDLVREDQGFIPETKTEILRTPGIDKLANKPVSEQAETFSQVLRSRPNITKLVYVVGSHFEVTSQVNSWELL